MKKQPLAPPTPEELGRSLREFEAGWEAMTGRRVAQAGTIMADEATEGCLCARVDQREVREFG